MAITSKLKDALDRYNLDFGDNMNDSEQDKLAKKMESVMDERDSALSKSCTIPEPVIKEVIIEKPVEVIKEVIVEKEVVKEVVVGDMSVNGLLALAIRKFIGLN